MTRDDLAPLGDEHESFPCPSCGGSGRIHSVRHLPDVIAHDFRRCEDCGGSGYGPPPPSLDREKSHCLQRLSAWAHRDTVKQEQ